MHSLTRCAAVFGFTAVASAAMAADLYVAPSGNDINLGTLASPLQTLARAVSLAQAGDTIYLRGGSYALTSGVNVTKSGASGNPLRIFAYANEVPVLDGAAMTSTSYWGGWPLVLSSASWLHVRGLEIRNGPMGGVAIRGASHFNVIERLNVHHNGRLSQWEGKGISLYGSSANNLLINNDSHHNRDLQQSNADGFQVSTTGGGNVLRGNRAWRNSDDGFDFFNIYDNTPAVGVLLEGNWSFENGYLEDGTASVGDGNGFKLGGRRSNTTGSSGGHTVRANLAWGNRNKGFDENAATLPLTLYNNTAYRNARYDFAFWTTAHILRNNLAQGSSLGVLMCCGAVGSVADHNSWTLPVTVDAADFVSVDASGATGPRQTDGSLPRLEFLRPVGGSDLVDAGVDVGLAYQGAAPDLGALERTADNGDTSPPSTPTGLNARADGAASIQLVWVASLDDTGVTGYRVLRNGSVVATSVTTSHRDTGLNALTTYGYRVQALDAAGNASGLSAAASAKTWRYSIGQRIRLSGKTRVYASAGGAAAGTQARNALGTVTAGPVTAAGYEWWQVDFDGGVDGWLRFTL